MTIQLLLILLEENCLHVSAQFYLEKQTDGATYRNTCLEETCICFHLASNNLSRDKGNIIDCAPKIELQNGFQDYFSPDWSFRKKTRIKNKPKIKKKVLAAVCGCSKYTLNSCGLTASLCNNLFVL